MKEKWWKKSVVYQIYPASFQDTNGDGTGDLRGIISRLDYIEKLGVNVIWLCPINDSPMCDMGYDISDYYRINPIFGSNEDFEALISEAGKRGIKVLMDLVVNHCSDQHRWFKEAVKDPSSPYNDYFFIVETEDGSEPNNLRSHIGGSCWQRIGNTNRFYYHGFSAGQPDLNWDNPALRDEIIDMMCYWQEKGVAGFRVDAIGNLKKSPETFRIGTFPPDGDDGRASVEPYVHLQPGIEDFLREMRDRVFRKYDSMTVAEAGIPEEQMEEFLGEEGYFSMAFDFSYANLDVEIRNGGQWLRDWSTGELKSLIFTNMLETQRYAWAAPYLENHDQPRSIDKYIPSEDISRESITALGALYFFLRGTPYIYQGQELGMRNCPFKDISDFRDPFIIQRYVDAPANCEDQQAVLDFFRVRGRDNSRTPMQWDGSANAGFTDGEPWIMVNPDYKVCNAEQQLDDEKSIFSFYRLMTDLRLRSEYSDILTYGLFEPIESEEKLITYRRVLDDKAVTVAVNFSPVPLALPESCRGGKVILNNYSAFSADQLEPYQSVLLLN